MSDQNNLPEMAAATIAAIQRMDEGVTADHPEYHAIGNLKRAAEQAVIDGLRSALAIAESAHNVRDAVTRAGEIGAEGATKP